MAINDLLEKIGNEINEHVKKNDNGKQQLINVIAFIKGGGIIDPIYEYVNDVAEGIRDHIQKK